MTILDFVLVSLFGCLVGAAELVSRHSDYRFYALVTAPSLAYMFLNAMLSVFALIAIDYIGPEWLGYKIDANGKLIRPDTIWLVLTAGFSAAAFFRSSLFKLKTQDGDISVGPAIVIDIFLSVIDEAVDRVIGNRRLGDVAKILENVDFQKAVKPLPTLCFAGLRRLSPEMQRQFAVQLKELIDTPDLSDQVRVLSLGLSIMNLTGKVILEEAVVRLGESIKIDAKKSDNEFIKYSSR